MSIYQGTFTKNFSEPKKVAVRRSRPTALLKALIHVAPMGFAFFKIMINVRGRWVGGSFTNQSHYQLVAKAHEILIDASLTSIVLSYIQYELTAGNGLPFGAFLGGLQFLSVSYLWSRELWASAFATCYSLRKTRGICHSHRDLWNSSSNRRSC